MMDGLGYQTSLVGAANTYKNSRRILGNCRGLDGHVGFNLMLKKGQVESLSELVGGHFTNLQILTNPFWGYLGLQAMTTNDDKGDSPTTFNLMMCDELPKWKPGT